MIIVANDLARDSVCGDRYGWSLPGWCGATGLGGSFSAGRAGARCERCRSWNELPSVFAGVNGEKAIAGKG